MSAHTRHAHHAPRTRTTHTHNAHLFCWLISSTFTFPLHSELEAWDKRTGVSAADGNGADGRGGSGAASEPLGFQAMLTTHDQRSAAKRDRDNRGVSATTTSAIHAYLGMDPALQADMAAVMEALVPATAHALAPSSADGSDAGASATAGPGRTPPLTKGKQKLAECIRWWRAASIDERRKATTIDCVTALRMASHSPQWLSLADVPRRCCGGRAPGGHLPNGSFPFIVERSLSKLKSGGASSGSSGLGGGGRGAVGGRGATAAEPASLQHLVLAHCELENPDFARKIFDLVAVVPTEHDEPLFDAAVISAKYPSEVVTTSTAGYEAKRTASANARLWDHAGAMDQRLLAAEHRFTRILLRESGRRLLRAAGQRLATAEADRRAAEMLEKLDEEQEESKKKLLQKENKKKKKKKKRQREEELKKLRRDFDSSLVAACTVAKVSASRLLPLTHFMASASSHNLTCSPCYL